MKKKKQTKIVKTMQNAIDLNYVKMNGRKWKRKIKKNEWENTISLGTYLALYFSSVYFVHFHLVSPSFCHRFDHFLNTSFRFIHSFFFYSFIIFIVFWRSFRHKSFIKSFSFDCRTIKIAFEAKQNKRELKNWI